MEKTTERIDSKIDRTLSFFEEQAAPKTKVPRMDSNLTDTGSSLGQVNLNTIGAAHQK